MVDTESILSTIKKMLGIDPDYTNFDVDIILHINAVLALLTQLGVGPAEGYAIVDSSDTWADFIGSDPRLSMVQSYIYLKVRLLFDPPTSSAAMEATNRLVSELEWRLNVAVDPGDTTEEVTDTNE